MNRYKVISPLAIRSGQIALTIDQARHRFGVLKKGDNDVYTILGSIEFIVGEEIVFPEPVKDLGILSKLEVLELDNPVVIGVPEYTKANAEDIAEYEKLVLKDEKKRTKADKERIAILKNLEGIGG